MEPNVSNFSILCENITSKLISVRKQNYTQFYDLFKHPSTIECLKSNAQIRHKVWNSLKTSLTIDYQHSTKRSTGNQQLVRNFISSADLIIEFVKISFNHGFQLPFKDIYSLFTTSIQMKYYYYEIYLEVFEYILAVESIWQSITPNEWIILYESFLKVFKRKLVLREVLCLGYVVKSAPNYTSLKKIYSDFADFSKGFEKIVSETNVFVQIAVLDLLNDFIAKTAVDNRVACCELGEKVAFHILEIYRNNRRKIDIKSKVIKFFTVQMMLHHPKGITNTHPLAIVTLGWSKILEHLFYTLLSDIGEQNRVNSETCNIPDEFSELIVRVFQQISNDVITERFGGIMNKIQNNMGIWLQIFTLTINTDIELFQIIIKDKYLDLLAVLVRLTHAVENFSQQYVQHLFHALIAFRHYETVHAVDESNFLWTECAKNVLSLNLNSPLSNQLLDSIAQFIKHPHDVLKRNLHEKYFKTNLNRINFAFKHFPYLLSDEKIKLELMENILPKDHSLLKCDLLELTNVLVMFAFKQWITKDNTNILKTKQQTYDEIEIAPFFLHFHEIVGENIKENETKIVVKSFVNVDSVCLDKLLQSLIDLNNYTDEIEFELFKTVLFFNVLDNFLKYEIFTKKEILNTELWSYSELLLVSTFDKLANLSVQTFSDELLTKIEILLEIGENNFVGEKIRELLTTEHVKLFFVLVNSEQVQCKHLCISILVKYCLLASNQRIVSMQNFGMLALLNLPLDTVQDYKLFMQTLTEFNANNKFNFISSSEVYTLIFSNLAHINSHFVNEIRSDFNYVDCLFNLAETVFDDSIYRKFVSILLKYATILSENNFNINIKYIQCLGKLLSITSNPNDNLLTNLIEFYSHFNINVRLSAVDELTKYFLRSSCEIQTNILLKMQNLLINFQLVDRQTTSKDKFIADSAIILQTVAILMIQTNIWTTQLFVYLIQLNNIENEQFYSILNRVAIGLNYEVCDEFQKELLVTAIKQVEFSEIDNYVFDKWHCSNKIEFFAKYWVTLAPLVVLNYNLSIINEIATSQNVSAIDLIISSTPSLLTYCLAEAEGNLNDNAIFKFLLEALDLEQFRHVVLNDIDKLCINLLDYVENENDFQTDFNEEVKFLHLSYFSITKSSFFEKVQVIESVFKINLNIYLLNESPLKFYKILVDTLVLMNQSKLAEQKLKRFYQFAILAEYCFEQILLHDIDSEFFPCHIINIILNIIKTDDTKIKFLALQLFHKIFHKILPKLHEIVRKYFLKIVNVIKNIESKYVTEIFDMLFLSHQTEIHRLVVIPNKYHFLMPADPNLIETIQTFNNFANAIGPLNDYSDELNFLHKLIQNSNDLNLLIHDRNDILIQFISTLNKIKNNNRNEVVNVLSAIGCFTLDTLHLQTESRIMQFLAKPIEMLCEWSLIKLTKLLMSENFLIQKTASLALEELFLLKVSRHVLNRSGFTEVSFEDVGPFVKENAKNNFYFKIGNTNIENDELWIPEESSISYSKWTLNLVLAILESFEDNLFVKRLAEMAKIDTEFCEDLLPLIIYILCHQYEVFCKLFTEKINSFLKQHWASRLDEKRTSIVTDDKAIRLILRIVEFARLQDIANAKCFKLQINYLLAAKAAHFCRQPFHTIFFIEHWIEERSPLILCQSNCKYQLVMENVTEHAEYIQFLLRDAYKSLGQTNALDSCNLMFLTKDMTYYLKETSQHKVLIHHYQMQTEINWKLTAMPIIENLKHLELYNMVNLQQQKQTIDYESLWRLGQWNSDQHDDGNSFDFYKYKTLQSLTCGNKYNYNKYMNMLQMEMANYLDNLTCNVTVEFYEMLSKMQAVKEIKEFSDILIDFNENDSKFDDLLLKWSKDLNTNNAYEIIEPIKTQRMILITKISDKIFKPKYKSSIVNLLLDFAEYTCLRKHQHASSKILENIAQLPFLESEDHFKIQLKYAQITNSLNDKNGTNGILKKLLTNTEDIKLHSMSLIIYGEFLSTSGIETSKNVVDNNLIKAVDLLKNYKLDKKENEIFVKGHYFLATYALDEFEKLVDYTKSETYQVKLNNVQNKKLDRRPSQSKDQKKTSIIDYRQSTWDEEYIKSTKERKKYLMKLVIKHFLVILGHSNKYDFTIFRLFSFLIHNKRNKIVQTMLFDDVCSQIDISKCIQILPQLIPHIVSTSGDEDFFSQGIANIIEQCAKHYPHHTLPLLLSITNSNKDSLYGGESIKDSRSDLRIKSARKLIEQVKRCDENLAQLIDQMDTLYDALIELAYAHLEDTTIPNHYKIRKIKNFDVLIPTLKLSVNETDKNKLIGIYDFGKTVEFLPGQNHPIKITCIGSDGIERHQLLKGHDDLRQDAVMEQVFTIMNNLLSLNNETKSLRIRTFKVVPLSMCSGLVEWVGTTTLGAYLYPAHKRYRPQDLSILEAKHMYIELQSLSARPERQRKYLKLCKQFQPVLHNYFIEKYTNFSDSYQKRVSYINSVATTSMCSYMLGIGDRHVANILMDENTGELIHVDFGIAFEQGRNLPVAETVPFRLTRDIIDGMGVFGTTGVFVSSCEKTIQVLRDNWFTILSIIQVLLYDPLYDWIVTTDDKRKRQRDSSEFKSNNFGDENITAERALERVKWKLLGIENRSATTVKEQVENLILEATSVEKLSRMYHGWLPYM